MGEINVPGLEFTTRAGNLVKSPPESPHDSDLNRGKVPQFSGVNGDKLADLCLKDIKIATFDLGVRAENNMQFLPKLPFDDKAMPKLALPCLGPLDKLLAETSPREQRRLRRWRRVRRHLPDNPLQLNINFLVLATGYSLGIIGMQTTVDFNKKRVRAKDFGFVGKGYKTRRRATRNKRNAFSAESYLIAPDA
ncbi:hypothetical protein BS78_06G130400, partial [Paspalum vaginatum]